MLFDRSIVTVKFNEDLQTDRRLGGFKDECETMSFSHLRG